MFTWKPGFGYPAENAAKGDDENDAKGAVDSILYTANTVFHFWPFAVAALGFLTDSYNLFASNVILPAISYVYWTDSSDKYENGFNIATLLATMVGQVCFGWYADRYGRQAVYGYELLIVVVSTLGLLQSSQGYAIDGSSTWDFTTWLYFWRITMGVGIGAAYPLSAILAAEWSATKSRGRVMGAVFLMQPVGQMLACLVGLAAVRTRQNGSPVQIDQVWRIVIGVGAVPTLFTLLARWYLPESWRYTWYVAQNPEEALKNLKKRSREAPQRSVPLIQAAPSNVDSGDDLEAQTDEFRMHHDTQHQDTHLAAGAVTAGSSSVSSQHYSDISHNLEGYEISSIQHKGMHEEHGDDALPANTQTSRQASDSVADNDAQSLPAGLGNLKSFLLKDNKEYLVRLIGVSLSWWLLDYAFYGMGFSSSAIMAKLWAPSKLPFEDNDPWWLRTSDVYATYGSGSTVLDSTIRDVLEHNVVHVIYTTSVAAIVGAGFFVWAAPHINRRYLLGGSYAVLAVILIIISAVLGSAFHNGRDGMIKNPNGPWVLVFLWVLAQVFFSFGPNTLTFILPAEVFPTRYRCTCYGLAAAAGKLGAVFVQAIMWGVHNNPNDITSLRGFMASFAVAMALGAVLSFWERAIPLTQDTKHGRKRFFPDSDLALEECSDDSRFLQRRTKTQ